MGGEGAWPAPPSTAPRRPAVEGKGGNFPALPGFPHGAAGGSGASRGPTRAGPDPNPEEGSSPLQADRPGRRGTPPVPDRIHLHP